MRLVKYKFYILAVRIGCCPLFLLPVSCFCLAAHGFLKRGDRNPVHIRGVKCCSEQGFFISNVHLILRHILFIHVKRLFCGYAEPSSLPYRITHCPAVLSYLIAGGVNKITGSVFFARVALHEFHIIAIRHKAYVLAVMLSRITEALLLRDFSCLRFCEAPKRKHYSCKLLLREHIQHIALIFGWIRRLTQQISSLCLIIHHFYIVTRDDVIGAYLVRIIEQLIKLHISVAVYTGVWRAARLVCSDEFLDNLRFEIHCKIEHIIWNIQLKCDIACVVYILLRATGVVFAAADIGISVKPHRRSVTSVALIDH